MTRARALAELEAAARQYDQYVIALGATLWRAAE
jgi:hypothetical protein